MWMGRPMRYEDLPKSRREAAALGVTMFFTGKPCPRGHVAPRRIHSLAGGVPRGGSCIECAKSKTEEWNKGRTAGQRKRVDARRRAEDILERIRLGC